MMKYVICLLYSVFYLIGCAYAQEATLDGALDSIINIDVVEDNQLQSIVPDIRIQSTPAGGATVARIYCNNNNFNGFSLTFSSNQLGRLVFFKNNEYPPTLKDGHFIHYTLDLLRGDEGSLGLDMPPEIERKNFSLVQPYVVYFNDNIAEATYDAELILNMHTVKKSSLFHGVFQDTITVTIADL